MASKFIVKCQPFNYYAKTEQRQRLLVSNSRVDSTGESLVNAHRIAEETVNIGTNVLSELGSQRQQLERARDNV